MKQPAPKPIVSAEWLKGRLHDEGLRVVDASWRMPGGGDARADYDRRHIPGAVFFPIDEIADRSSGLPHMLPSADEFAAAVGALGISDADVVIVYDDQGLISAPRVWWTFKAMGHRAAFVLDGESLDTVARVLEHAIPDAAAHEVTLELDSLRPIGTLDELLR